MILITSKKLSSFFDLSKFSKSIIVDYESASIIRYEVFKLMLEGNSENLCIVMPEAKTIRVWNSRQEQFSIIDADITDKFLEKVSKPMFDETGALDEWGLSLLAISRVVPANSKIFCDKSLDVFKDYAFDDNIFFVEDLSDIDVS